MIRLLPAMKYASVAKCLLLNKMAGESVYPFYASFKLTTKCRFNCKFCNIKDDKRPDSPTDKIKSTLDNLSGSSVILVSFEGGEPLLRHDIGELLEYARTRNFYLLFTTSERHLEKYPMKEFSRYIDFLHISIDEGHDNLEMFDRLQEYRSFGARLSIQVVVSSDTISMLEDKVSRCEKAGANMVIMPAVRMNRTTDHFPDLTDFENEIGRLKHKYPEIIHTPDGFFNAIRTGRCSTASVIIDSDCRLYYPCHILETRGPDLSQDSLMDFLKGDKAKQLRKTMKDCERRCGWYQYFSINDFTSLGSAYRALKPAFSKRINRS